MLSNIIKSDNKALAKIIGNKKFYRSIDGNKEKYKNYLMGLVSQSFLCPDYVVTLPKEIIPNDITLNAFLYVYKKDPAALPIILRYFTHNNLPRDDLDKINQKLQSVINKGLEDLQGKKTELQGDETRLNNAKMRSEEVKALAIDKIHEQIAVVSSKIGEFESYKKNIEDFLNGRQVKSQLFSTNENLDTELIALQGDIDDAKWDCRRKKSEGKDTQLVENITYKISLMIKEIESCKKDIEGFLNDGEIKLSSYSLKPSSILNLMLESEVTKMMEEKLTAYAKGNKTDIEKIYQSFNNRAKKINLLNNVKITLQFSSALVCGIACLPFIAVFCQSCAGPSQFHYSMFYFFMHYSLPILLPATATLLALAGVIHLVNRHYEQSFVDEMEDFIRGPKHVDKATNTEKIEELKRERREQRVENLIDLSCNNDECNDRITSLAPPLNEEVKGPLLYPNLERCLPSSLNIME